VALDFVSETLLPQFVVNMGIEAVRQDVQSRAGFDLDSVLPIKCAPRAKCPALFGVAFDDTFVRPHHTEALHAAWGGEKTVRGFAGGHNGERPRWFLLEAARFLKAQCEEHGSNRRELPLQPATEASAWKPSTNVLAKVTREGRMGAKALAEKVLSARMPPPSPPPLMVAARHAADKQLRQQRQWKEPEPLRRPPEHRAPDVESCFTEAEQDASRREAPKSEALTASADLTSASAASSPRRRSFRGVAALWRSSVGRLTSARGRKPVRWREGCA